MITVTLRYRESRWMPIAMRLAALWLTIRPADLESVARFLVRFTVIEIPDGVAVQ